MRYCSSLLKTLEGLLPKYLTFSKRMKSNLFATVSTATEHNAKRNKQSLQAKIFSGVTHFRKTHLKRREVVMVYSGLNKKFCYKRMASPGFTPFCCKMKISVMSLFSGLHVQKRSLEWTIFLKDALLLLILAGV